MTKRSKLLFGGFVAASIAIACRPGTVSPTGTTSGTGTTSSRIIERPGKAPITDRQANSTFYDMAKNGFKTTIANFYTDGELGITVSNASIDYRVAKAKPMSTQADGPTHLDGDIETLTDDSPDTPTENFADEPGELEGLVTMSVSDSGKPPHTLRILEEDLPPMSTKGDEFTYTDETSGKVIKFSADQDFVRFTATDGQSKMVVVLNPDNTLTIDGRGAATVEEAADLIVGSSVCRNASKEALDGLYASLNQRKKDIQTLANVGRAANRGEAGPGEAVDIEVLVRHVLLNLKQ